MNNFFSIMFLCLMFLFSYAEVKAKGYKVNDIVENQFIMNKKFKLNNATTTMR